MSLLLDRCVRVPVRELAAGDVLIAEGTSSGAMFVVIDGEFEVSHRGSGVARIAEPGAVLGEISVLLDVDHGSTVTATSPARVHVIDRPHDFMAGDPVVAMEVARTLARRLSRMVYYLGDVKAQYGNAEGHHALLDEVLTELTFGEHPPVEPGSERDPDPEY